MTKEEAIKELKELKKKHGLESPKYRRVYKKHHAEWGELGRGLDVDLDHTNGNTSSKILGFFGARKKKKK